MEASIASVNGEPKLSNKASLSVLPADCLVAILSYGLIDLVPKLILTGNKVLILKLRHMRHLSLTWSKSSSFVDWSKASPLIRSLFRLESLELTTWTPLLLSQGPLNPGIFPPSLRSLTLRYCGCAELLQNFHAPALFDPLVSLEYFEIQDELRTSKYVSLCHFPSSLRSLHIQSKLGRSLEVLGDLTELRFLPSNLETLHLHMFSIGTASLDEIVYVWPPNLASVTDLSIRVNYGHHLDISSIAPQLKHLNVFAKALRFGDERDFPFSTAPLRTYFPVLESLDTTMFTLKNWQQLSNLPPSLTVLNVLLDTQLGYHSSNRHNVLEDLNEHCEEFGVLQYAAPKLLRRMEPQNATQISNIIPKDLRRHFPLLEFPDTTSKIIYEDLRRVSLTRAPELLTAGLTDLVVDGHLFEIAFLSHLPRSLERLVFRASEPVLKALVQHSNSGQLPHLATLNLLVAPLEADCRDSLGLNRNTVPSTVTNLKVQGNVHYRVSDPCDSLKHHLKLTSMHLVNFDLITTLPYLPARLQSLDISLSAPVNLAVPDQALALFEMRHHLHHLSHLQASLFSVTKNKPWLLPVSPDNPPQISLSRWTKLPKALKSLYAQCYLVKIQLGLVWSTKTLLESSELYALSCLPRGLSSLKLPTQAVASGSNVIWADELDLARAWDAILRCQLPLLALPVLHGRAPNPLDRVVKALPPALSTVNISESNDAVIKVISHHATGHPREDFVTPLENVKFWPLESAYHAANALSWMLIALYGPSSWKQNSPLQAFIWSSALGSALVAPILAWRLYKSGLVLPQLEPIIKTSAAKAFGGSFLLNMVLNASLTFALGSSSYRPIFRIASASVSLILSVGRNYFVQMARR